MLGNQQAKHIIQSFLGKIQETGVVNFPFVLIDAPEGVGAFSWVQAELAKVVGIFQQDMKVLRDLEFSLGKRHNFRVDVASKDQYVVHEDETYTDRGARQVSDWLSVSPAGEFKIVLIEHIERMNISAANALLKSFEEPLPGRLIIATTKNNEGLIDTIRSRAFVIRTVLPTTQGLISRYVQQGIERKKALYALALSGGEEKQMVSLLDGDADSVRYFQDLCDYIFDTGSSYQILGVVKSLGSYSAGTLLDALMVIASEGQYRSWIDRLLLAKRMISANVNAEHVWYELGLKE